MKEVRKLKIKVASKSVSYVIHHSFWLSSLSWCLWLPSRILQRRLYILFTRQWTKMKCRDRNWWNCKSLLATTLWCQQDDRWKEQPKQHYHYHNKFLPRYSWSKYLLWLLNERHALAITVQDLEIPNVDSMLVCLSSRKSANPGVIVTLTPGPTVAPS